MIDVSPLSYQETVKESGVFLCKSEKSSQSFILTNYCIDCTVKSAFERGFEVIIPEGTNSTFDNDYMTGETTVRYYNEDVWEELVDSVTIEEAIDIMSK